MQNIDPAVIALIGTIISAFVSLAISLITTSRSNDKNQAIFQERLDNLTEEVKKHNNIIERTYKLEAQAAVLDTRIDGLESALK